MARYLVTGGAGFIGGAVARRLLARGDEVVVLDLPGREAGAPPGAAFRAGDIGVPSTWDALPPVDAVLHLAAQTSARVSHEDPVRDVDTNARGTLLLAQWCLRHGVRRVVYASSMAVYGEPAQLPSRETDPPHPVSFYGVTKLAGEHYLLAHVPLGLDPVVLRLFNVYGPGQDMANLKQGMLSIYLAYLAAGQEIQVTGDLGRTRDFIEVEDVVDAWLLALDRALRHRVYNIATGRETSVRELIRLLGAAWGEAPRVRQVGPHAGDVAHSCGDAALFAAETGWSARVRLEDGIARMARWVRGA